MLAAEGLIKDDLEKLSKGLHGAQNDNKKGFSALW